MLLLVFIFFFFKQKTAYEMRISDWSSDVCSSDLKDLHAFYGESHILHGMDFEIRPGEVATLLGRNGAGKTTTLRAIMGMIGQRRGSIVFEGTETVGLASNRITKLGIAYCPEERGIFASLNVEEIGRAHV